MRKHSAFDSIPTLPRNFSGQWMTFSHMANHYRKLINVKPRVDTGIPHYNVEPQKPSKLSKSGGKTMRSERPGTTDGIIPKTKWSRPKLASKMVDYEYHALSKGLMNSPNGSFNAGSSSDGYQVVFGPSSIKSSVDAMISDPDPELEVVEPKLSSISIGEKIRKFLDHIHAQDSQPKVINTGRPLSTRERKQPCSISRDQMTDSRHDRHSKCFTPFEVSSSGTKKRLVKPSGQRSQRSELKVLSAQSRKSVSVAKVSESPKLSSNKRAFKRSPYSNSSTHDFHEVVTSIQIANNNNNIMNPKQSTGHKKSSKIEKRMHSLSPNMSPRSVSVGTIHGSDELTEEFLLDDSTTPPRNLSTIQLDREDLTTDWLKERVERGVVRINNAYFSLAPGTSTSSLGIHHPNKDSSRDSAYGFSSGESRITTRESTPEKKSRAATKGSSEIHNGKYKSSLSTVASSINQDISSHSHVDSSGHSSCSEKSILHNFRQSREKKDLLAEEKYYHFLTKVTDDIVSRGIYTNKGIKSIFKSHLMKNSNLEMDKMLSLLERLRIDMGVPKDDSLNQLDFGYGSVEYSTGPYFYSKSDNAPSPEGPHSPSESPPESDSIIE
ncbi:unnamed protein product [Allacma fusca]|uniref:Uncharacterized protein n=1 Tax=Allacma fusca TaxID=39272 RepID=A0A8J2NQ94_9HEXA|nr:unnamed protein product [Allacma fusca]